MHPWRILLDLDGTVAQNAGRRIAQEHFGIVITEEQSGQRLPELLGLTDDQFWAWWHANQEAIYAQATPLPGAPEAVRALKAAGAQIVIVTARRPSSEAVTTRWLEQCGVPYDHSVFGADDKVAVAKEWQLNIAFEDDPENAVALADFMPVVLIENFKNKHEVITHEEVYRVGGWHEVPPLLRLLEARSA